MESPNMTGRPRSLTRESTLTMGAMASKKPSLIPSTSFRAAQQLPRYSRHSVATTSIASPSVQGSRRSRKRGLTMLPDAFDRERQEVVAAAFKLDAKPAAKAPKETAFLKEDFWKAKEGVLDDFSAESPAALRAPVAPLVKTGYPLDSSAASINGSGAGAVKLVLPQRRRGSHANSSAPDASSSSPCGNGTAAAAAAAAATAAVDAPEVATTSVGSYSKVMMRRSLLQDNTSAAEAQPGKMGDGYMRLRASSLGGTESSDAESEDIDEEREFERSGYVQMEAPVDALVSSGPLWVEQHDDHSEEVRRNIKEGSAAPSFAASREIGHQIIDRFHRVVDLLNASPTPAISVQLDCHREMHMLTANFRNDAVMYGRVIISEVALPVTMKTIKPLDSSGVLGGDKFAIDRHNIFGGDEDAAHKVAGHELKSLVQVMECGLPGLRYPLLCIVDYMGFRLIAMSTLPIKGRTTLQYGSMDAGKTVATSPETLELTKKLAAKLNLKEHGLKNQPKATRIWTPADLELHRGSDGNLYALDFSRLFPPDKPKTADVGGVFYRLLRPEFVRAYPRPLCSDTWTSFMDPEEGEENMREIAHAHSALMALVAAFGARLEKERPQENLIQASDKLINLMHMRGINCRFLGRVRASCTSPYWRLVLLLEMVTRRLKKILFHKLRKAMLRNSTTGVSVCIGVALRFLNRVIGESDESSHYWQDVVKASVHDYFEHGLSERELARPSKFKESVCSAEHSRTLMQDVRAQMLTLLCQKTGLKLSSLTRASIKSNPRVIRVPTPFDDADLHELGVSVTYVPIASFSGGKLKRLTAMETSRRAKAYELNLSAARLYAQALRMNPADAQLLRNCAEVEAALGNDLRANEFFSLAMEVDPNDAATAFKYAIFFDHAMQLDLAEKWYLEALRLVDKFHRMPVMLSTYADFLLTERRNLVVARQLYERVLAAAPLHTQTLHNLAVLLYDEDAPRAKQLFKLALDNSEDESRVALISRACAMFHLHIHETPAGLAHYARYKELKHLVIIHPPTLYHATRSQFGPEMEEIREILGPTNQFKVRHIFWDHLASSDVKPDASLHRQLERSIRRLFDRLQVPCSTEISFLSVGTLQIPAWEFDRTPARVWAAAHQGASAVIGIILGYLDGAGLQLFEESLEGTIVLPKEGEEFEGWDGIFKVKGFGKTLSEMMSYMAMLNVRRRAYLRMWTTVQHVFDAADGDDDDVIAIDATPEIPRKPK